MPSSPVRIALVGLGGHGRRIQTAVAQVPALHVAAVFDPAPAEAEDAAQRFRCEAAESFEALLERDDLDAVALVTPNAVHPSQTLAAVHAGLDVFVEKPIANTVADGQSMVEAADAANRIVMVGHNIRRGAAARTARRLLNEGCIGEVVSAEIHYSADNVQKGTHEGWRFRPGQCPMLPMMQLGIHAIDLVHYLLGPVRQVHAHARSVLTPPGVVDAVTGWFLLDDGKTGTVVSSYCTPDLFNVRLAGTDGVMDVSWIPHALSVRPRGSRTEMPEQYAYGDEGHDLVDQMQAFATAVQTRTPPETDGRVGLQALAVVEAMQESAQTNRPVDVARI